MLAEEKNSNPNAKANEAWGWLPPPLVGEGSKVQTDGCTTSCSIRSRSGRRSCCGCRSSTCRRPRPAGWRIILRPSTTRDYPYEFDPAHARSYLAAEKSGIRTADDALKIVTDNNYCVKCHRSATSMPAGSRRQAPQLDRVSKRLRPEFVVRWVANPKRHVALHRHAGQLPHDKPADQKLYHGTSDEQLQAVVDLLLELADVIWKDKHSIKPMVKPAAALDGVCGKKNDQETHQKPAPNDELCSFA